MAKKTRMGRNLNALLGGATRTRNADSDEQPTDAKKSGASATAPATQSASNLTGVSSADAISRSESKPSVTPVSKPTVSSGAVATNESSPDVDTGSSNTDNSISSITTTEQTASASDAASNVIDNKTLAADSHPSDRLRMLGVDQITRGIYQPRRHFDQELLQELADSIKAQGLIQPILVRAYGGKFELIAGERRWRASQLAGITDIPAIVRDMDDQSVAAVSLIENIQRADLNPLEEAQALERLCEEFSMTHQQVAEAVGRSRVAVTNLMRLLELHDGVKTMVDNGELDMGHARALLGAPQSDQPEIAKRIVQQGLTVRAVEKLVKDIREGRSTSTSAPSKSDPNIDALGQKLSKQLGASVNIKHQQNGSGKLEISYSSIDELEGILSHIK